MKNQKSTAFCSNLNSASIYNFTEIERLRSLNELLKGAKSNIPINALNSLSDLKQIIEKKP